MIKKFVLWLVLILGLCSVVFAFDSTRNVTINENDLPFSGGFEFPVLLQENQTLFFNVTTSDSRFILYNYTPSYYLNGTSQYNFVLNYSLPRTMIIQNESFVLGIKMTNSLNLNNYTIGLYFTIVNQESPIFDVRSSSSLQLVNGMYVKNVSLLDFPNNGNLSFMVSGTPNERFNVSGCELNRFLRCSNTSFVMGQNGTFALIIPYDLVFTPLGVYNDSFNVSSGATNNSSIVKVQFNVLQPDIFVKPADIDPICLKNETLLTINQRFFCEQKLAEYRLKAIIQLNDYYSRINTENICSQFTKTEYIIGDTISTKVLDENLKLIEENRLLRIQNDKVSSSFVSCSEDKLNIQTDLQEEIARLEENIIEINTSAREKNIEIFKAGEQQREKEKSDLVAKLILLCVFAIICCIVLAVFKSYREQVLLKDVKISYWVLLIIGLCFTFALFGLWVWS